jgi:hypothetical protein
MAEISSAIKMARDITELVRDAILSERERCAKIAENNDHFPQEGEFIARLIRQDNAP